MPNYDNKLNLQKTLYVQLKLYPSPENFTRTQFAWFATNCKSVAESDVGKGKALPRFNGGRAEGQGGETGQKN